MKSVSVILFTLLGVCLYHQASAIGSQMLDRVNVDSYLRNPKMIEYHIRCLVYDGPCDKIGNEIKRLLPLVGKQCRGCSEEQKSKLGKIINHIQRNYPAVWQDMVKKLRSY